MPNVFAPDIPELPKQPAALPDPKLLEPPKATQPAALKAKKQKDSELGVLALLSPLISSPS